MVVVVPLVYLVRGAAAHPLGRRRAVRRPSFTRFRASAWASSTCATSRFIFRSAFSCSILTVKVLEMRTNR